MTGQSHHFVIAVTDFDTSLLPADARTHGTDAFAAEVSKLLRAEYESFGGSARIVVSASEIVVAWTEGPVDPDLPPDSEPIFKLELGLSQRQPRSLAEA